MKKNTDRKDTELKVLVLEDSHEDLELMREQLLNAGYRLDLTHVEHEAGYTDALRENSFDLVLADFNLPDIDGFGALKICRELCPDTPFICVSGTIGEETAVELLKLGAVDYVLKDKLERLSMAVKRALEEAKAKADYQKAAEALKKSEAQFDAMFENMASGSCLDEIIYDKGEPINYRILKINPAFEKILGIKRDKALGALATEVYNTKEPPLLDVFSEVAKTGIPQDLECYFQPTGQHLHLTVGCPKPGFFSTVFTDITGRKLIENELKEKTSFLSTIMETSPVGIVTVDKTGNITYANNRAEQILGLVKEEITSSTYDAPLWKHIDLDGSPFPDEKQPFNIVKKSLKTVLNIQHGISWPDGTIVILSINAAPIKDNNGKFNGMIASIEDITEHKRAEKALRDSEEKMRGIYSVAPAGIGVVFNRVLKEVNPRVCEMTGYTREELLGKNSRILYPSQEEYDFVGKEKYDQIREKGIGKVETRWQKKDGSIINILLSSAPIGRNDSSRETIFTALDITERKRAEEQIMSNEARLQSLVRIMQHQSESVQEFLDYALEEAIQLTESRIGYIYFYSEEKKEFTLNTWSDGVMDICGITEPQTIYQLEKTGMWGEAVRQRKEIIVNDFQAQHPLKKGYPQEHAPLHKYLTVPVFRGEVIVAVVGVANKETDYEHNDVLQLQLLMDGVWKEVEAKRAEETMRESEDRFKKLSSFTFEGIIIHNDAIAIDINNSALELLGYERDEIIGRNLFDLIHPDYHPLVKENLAKQVAKPYQIIAIRKDGSTFDGEIEARNISYNDEYFRVACLRDITERKKMLEELVAARDKAEESDRLKTAFLNNISHEIRTPLNGILGFGELISGIDLSREEIEEMVRHVRQSSKRLTDTVSNYMDMARIVSGTMEVHKKEFPLPSLLEEAVKELKPLCEKKKIGLKSVIPEQCVGISLFSDRDIILKIINILLDNSLKFTSQGEIICGCRLIPEYLEFYVQDTGPGIADDKLEIIFDIFSQEDISDTRTIEGSGLGLSIASGLTDLLGGSISVTSEKGKGSTFTFTVPYKAAELTEKVPPAEKKTDYAARKPLVLLAEDEESNYLYLEVILKKAGYEYLLAKNGEEAVAYCKQHPEITLVLMDIKMPVMNGEEATRHIREFRPDLPIIATTAYAQTGDKQRFLAAGFDEYLPKPIKSASLLSTIKNYPSLKS